MRQEQRSGLILNTATRIIAGLSTASFIVRTLVIGLLALTVSGLAHAIAQPALGDQDAENLVKSIVAGEADLNQVPNQFIADMGYTPVASSGTLRKPEGGCSTPVELGPDPFDSACQTHDLGYDLLRYAEREGTRLQARARLELDWRLYVDLLQSCGTPTCSAKATAYFCAVSANSIRQGYKAPHAEPTTPWMALVVGIFGLSTAAALPATRAKFDIRPEVPLAPNPPMSRQ